MYNIFMYVHVCIGRAISTLLLCCLDSHSVSPSQEVKRGGGYNFSMGLDVLMTTSKKTKLGKGGGGAPWYPPLGQTLG